MSDNQIIRADQSLPQRLLIIPLMGKPIFPGIFTPVMISSDEDIQVVNESIEGDSNIGLLMVRNEEEEPSPSNLHKTGTVARIVKKINLPDGGINIFISTIKRFRVKKFLAEGQPLVAAVDYVEDEEENSPEVKALTRSLLTEMKQISDNNPLFTEEMRLNMVNIDHPGKIADFITSILNIEREQQQAVLENLNIQKRMEQVLVFIKKEQELLRIQKKIQKQINERIEKNQRDYFLREELKTIKHELGMDVDSKSSEYNRFKTAIEKLPLEGEVLEQVEQELQKFSLMDPNSSEFVVTRNYLDTIVRLPWEDPKPKEINITRGQKILDKDHYGLEDVKKRIMEYLAVRKLKKDTRGSIICLVGPPGVGKTSVGKSIARALNRPFFRFSVGGMRDEAEIKGHRRTYVGAMPGKIIQGLKIVKSRTPVFMIDEIDKLGASYQGDPSSALLEVLDPEQNTSFRDNYLDIPYDISHVLFIVTANTLDTIPRPLLDRMEVIRLSGYIKKEKVEIARKYLIPRSMQRAGLTRENIKFQKTALDSIAENYSREAGMRSYEKALDKIHRKAAHRIVTSEEPEQIVISRKNLSEFLGNPIFRKEEIKKATQPGTAIGLAWTNFGGDTLMIEALAVAGKGVFKLTGQMGEVMKESAGIALSHVQSLCPNFKVDSEYFNKHSIHLHIPEGATPKDGPSAGITMASALLSLITEKRLKKDLAMTGELSLTGQVLPIGGLKEKTIAARRNKIKTILIPQQNTRDLEEIPDHVKEGITFIPVKTFSEVVKEIFPAE